MQASTRPTEKKMRFFSGKSVCAIVVCEGRRRANRRRAASGMPMSSPVVRIAW